MNPTEATAPLGHDDEVSALLEVLLKTGQRLEELTAGEVDTVVDRDGRTFMLRGTQEQLRQSEFARQAAMLNKSLEEFRTLAESMPQIVWITLPDGANIYFNQQWMDYTGLTLEQSLGDGWNRPFHPEDRQHAWDAWQHATATHGTYALECRLRRADGEYRWWLIRGIPQHDATGTILKWFGTCTDIHDLKMIVEASKLAESKLLIQTKRLSLAVAVAKVGVWEWDLISDTLMWHDTVFAIYGFASAEEMPYERWSKAVHPEDLPGVEATLRRTIDEKGEGAAEFRIVLADGSTRNISSAQKVVLDRDGKVCRLIGVNVDVTDRKLAEEALRSSEARMTHLAEHDFLTGLPNRMLLNDRIGRTIELARRNRKKAAVLFLDMDGFKHINDSLGHPTGDMLLQAIGKSLVECVRTADTVSRQGGDEFIVLLPEVEHPEGTIAAAKRMLEAVASVHSIAQTDLQITCCIGVSIYPDDGLDAETLIKRADIALYQAKENGQSNYQFFRPEMNVRAIERQSIEQDLRRALSRHEFVLHYQPVVNLKTQAITGAEALIRWNHPTRGLIPPGEFIPIAEDSGLILPIGSWVLEESCRQVRAWMDAGLPEMTMAVNVSALQFQSGNFTEDLFAILFNIGLDPKFIELEVTESLLMKRPDFAASVLHMLREKGVQVAIDDFGTGYSSLSYLSKLPLDTLKVDQSFVRQITTTPNGTSIVAAIIAMGQNLRLRVIAEGVETVEELNFLQGLGCDEAQGYLFSRPVTSDKFEALVVSHRASETLWPEIFNFS
jgi:diguanylate cyclase (GGDEF)-like protein/PAS domain S-box-containing protein